MCHEHWSAADSCRDLQKGCRGLDCEMDGLRRNNRNTSLLTQPHKYLIIMPIPAEMFIIPFFLLREMKVNVASAACVFRDPACVCLIQHSWPLQYSTETPLCTYPEIRILYQDEKGFIYLGRNPNNDVIKFKTLHQT